MRAWLVLRGVDRAFLANPRHHLAQPRPDFLDRQLGGHATLAEQSRRAGAVLEHEVLRVLAVLDAVQRLAHALAHALVDDLRPGDVLAVLGIVRDRVVHGADAAFVHQVDDQFQLVQALEVRHLGRVARVHQRIEARLHQLDGAAAEHRLLAEEVGLRFLLEIGLDDARLAAADRRRVGQRDVALSYAARSEEHTSELQSRQYLVCRLLLEKKTPDQDSSPRKIERAETWEQAMKVKTALNINEGRYSLPPQPRRQTDDTLTTAHPNNSARLS